MQCRPAFGKDLAVGVEQIFLRLVRGQRSVLVEKLESKDLALCPALPLVKVSYRLRKSWAEIQPDLICLATRRHAPETATWIWVQTAGKMHVFEAINLEEEGCAMASGSCVL